MELGINWKGNRRFKPVSGSRNYHHPPSVSAKYYYKAEVLFCQEIFAVLKWMDMKYFWRSILLVAVLSQYGFCSSSTINFVVEPSVAWQGKTLVVKVLSAEGVAEIKGSFLDQQFKGYKNGGDFRGIVGVPIDQEPGGYNLKLIITSKNGKIEETNKEMRVRPTKFPFSKFWLPPARDKLRAREIIDEEWARIEKVLLVNDPVQRWKGRFFLPAFERISQGFGHRQIINGKRAGSHRGVDIVVPAGTKVKAPNAGKVVFREKLKAFGGTMVLDHGQGVHTLYFHLSKLSAEVGKQVEKGEVIALSGNSGVSSGAHLHWGLSVHDLRVDPMQWVNTII